MRTQDYQYLSIWEVAHRWENADPDAATKIGIISKLGERLRQLVWAATHALNCFDQQGELIPMEELWITGVRKTRFAKKLDHSFSDPGEHRDFLKTVYLSQDEVKKLYGGMEPLPSFWFEDWEIEAAGRHLRPQEEQLPATPAKPLAASVQPQAKLRPDQQDKITCQGIAQRLWEEHPHMTIADMIKRPEIQIEGNGKAYSGKNTLRNWLKAVAPASVRNRRGRPKKGTEFK